MALWDKITSRGQVEDRRGLTPVVGGISLTGIAIILLFNTLLGGDPAEILNQLETIPVEPQQNYNIKDFEGEDSYEVFAETVLGSNNDMWSDIFEKSGRTYDPPQLILFRTATNSSCGTASSQVGPHYCPLDEYIYLDETFFEELINRFDAKGGDVAEAYIISHEVGHHVQNKLGIMDEVKSQQENNPGLSNELSVKLELQADCFAGLWANSIKALDVFLPGEIAEAMDAASSVGDDKIQEMVNGMVNPENWTHGSSEQRVYWFNKGFESGSLNECNTFT